MKFLCVFQEHSKVVLSLQPRSTMFCLRGYVFAFLILYSRQQPFKNIYFPVRAA